MRNIDTMAMERSQESILATNKVIRNTYMLLAMTLVFSAVTAGISMAINPPPFTGIITFVGALVFIFALHKMQNSVWALPMVFAFTGLLGFGLGPLLNAYLAMANGGQIIMTALGMTGAVFMGLSAYVLTSKKDFSFMGGFLAAGAMIMLVGILALFILPLFGVDVSGFHLAMSAFIVILMSGFILYDTSNIVNGVYTNYIMATVGLYLNIYNLFVSLLHLVGAFSDD